MRPCESRIQFVVIALPLKSAQASGYMYFDMLAAVHLTVAIEVVPNVVYCPCKSGAVSCSREQKKRQTGPSETYFLHTRTDH